MKFQEFIAWMRENNYAERTIYDYWRTFQAFESKYDEVTEENIRQFLRAYENPASQKKYLSHFLAYAKWAGVTLTLRSPKLHDKPPEYIRESVREDILTALDKHKWRGAWCILTIIDKTGLRFNEAYSLTSENLKYGSAGRYGMYWYLEFAGKGGRIRKVPLVGKAKQAIPAVRKWLGMRVKPSQETLRRHIRAAEKEAGVEGLKPHWFRKSFGTDILNNGGSYERVANVLGNSPEVVYRSYARFNDRNLIETMEIR